MLLVAGAPAAGKSTFMQRLREGALPPAIRAELPDGCESWEPVHAFAFDAFLKGRSEPGATDIVLHYDLMRAWYHGLPTLLEDPPIANLTDVGTIFAVTLRTPVDRLWHQFARRSLGGTSPAETRALARRAQWAQTLDSARAKAVGIFSLGRAGKSGKPSPSPSERRRLYELALLDAYARRGFLEPWFAQWRALLDSLANSGILVKEIDVAPTGNVHAEHEHGWVLLGANARDPFSDVRILKFEDLPRYG